MLMATSSLACSSSTSTREACAQVNESTLPGVFSTPLEDEIYHAAGICEEEEWCVLTVGDTFVYSVPYFPALSVVLRQIKVQRVVGVDETELYDIFIRNDPSLLYRSYPTTLLVKYAFAIENVIFSTRINISSLELPASGACILWEWEWTEEWTHPGEEGIDSEVQVIRCESESEAASESSERETQLDASMTHTVTFKCIGSNHSSASQTALKAITECAGDDVPVMIYPEPDNPVDSQAIAFRAKISGKWHTIGYVVREALPHVHMALRGNKITSVEFSWVKYMVQWTRSGPGYYAGINVTTKGKWPPEVGVLPAQDNHCLSLFIAYYDHHDKHHSLIITTK